jgi:alkanesulfonate monooxygenase SsuD/methylene tetrahydromethanopterin reductase-like flavin-dependent oxidoreductase (luciferase family)
LGATVGVLSTDDPIRVFQQLATAAAIAPGRIEVVAGRGSSAITFSIFDLEERDYDMLFSSKLDLLLALNGQERVTWNGPHRRRALKDMLVVPRPEQPLRIWLGTGGSPESVLRATALGVPMFLGWARRSESRPPEGLKRACRIRRSEVPWRMLRMDQVHVVRHKVLVEGRSQRAVARELGLARVTVRKYLDQAIAVRRPEKARGRPVWDAVGPRVEALLAESVGWTGGKQRLTATRLHALLVAEGQRVGVTVVRAAVDSAGSTLARLAQTRNCVRPIRDHLQRFFFDRLLHDRQG